MNYLKEFKMLEIPFDAMIRDETYIMGFLIPPHFGVVDLNKMEYKENRCFRC